MRSRELKPIFDAVRKRHADLSYHKTLLLLSPMRGLLRAVHLDASAFSKDDFTVTAFMMPLCVPTDHIHLTFGFRIRSIEGGWSMLMPDLVKQMSDKVTAEAMPFFSSAPSLSRFPEVARKYFGNPHGPKEAAFALARVGEIRQAVDMIEDYLPRLDLSSHWQREIEEDSRALRHLLLYEPALAAAKLKEWEDTTIRNLGLERFR